MNLGTRLPTSPHPCHILAILATFPRTAFVLRLFSGAHGKRGFHTVDEKLEHEAVYTL